MTRRRLGILQELQRELERIPVGFVDDGCSVAPDWLFGKPLRPACRVHDWKYCTRAWPSGELDQEHRARADRFLGRSVRALLPLGLGWIGWFFARAVHVFGGDAAFDSCGPEVGTRCRHHLLRPRWMR